MNTFKKRDIRTDQLSLKNEIIGIILLFSTLFVIFSLISYSPNDPSFFHSTSMKKVQNYCGRLGAEISAFLFNLFGYASFIVMLFLVFLTVYHLFNRKIKNMITKSTGYFLLTISLSEILRQLFPAGDIREAGIKSGGAIGYILNSIFTPAIKPFFTFLLFFSLIFISLFLIAKISLKKSVSLLTEILVNLYRQVKEKMLTRKESYLKDKQRKKITEKYQAKANEKKVMATEEKTEREKKQPSRIPEETYLFSELEKKEGQKKKSLLPPLTYLDAQTEKSQIDYQELEEKRNELSQRLEEFRIKGKIVEYTPGPVITTYEFVPDIGVKVKDVAALAEDLALVAKAQYVRIERILGKKAIGIEVPNKKREIISLREILESKEYQQSHSPLTLALGKSKNGEIFITDLQEMPHLIIAGATGSGKSVAIHTIILSILFKATSDEVKLILIDPKRVELAIYNSLPHLLTPVVVNTKLAKNALDWAIFEMETRYKKLFALQVRNIEQYNKKIDLMTQSGDEALEKLEDKEKLPYVVIIIDEFADLMMECGRDIEDNVARIAHKARAVGIHLILATQRPSIDVITGTIKNNFPSRIALAVPSKHDSRTIIDVGGAEKLLGHGDMLFLPPKTASLIRLHCAYVSEEEALRVVNYLAKIEKPIFNTQIVRPKAKANGDNAENDEKLDSMFFEAARTIINSGQASASFLQRRLSIGYARAGRLIDQLQNRGIITPPDNKSQRRILLSLEQVEEMEGTNDSDIQD